MKTKAQSTAIACVILAAGKGTRMRSTSPKVMHALAHRPMLLHVVDMARVLRAERIIAVTAPEMISARDALKRTYKDSVENAIQQEARGTGDAVKAASAVLKEFKGVVLILYGDTPLIRARTLQALVEALRNYSNIAVAVLGMEVPTPNDYGKLIIDEKGNLHRIVEAREATPQERQVSLSNSGVMAVRGPLLHSLLARLSNDNAKGEYYLTDLVTLACEEGHRCVAVKGDSSELIGINSRVELAVAEAQMQARLRRQAMDKGATLLDPQSVYLAYDTVLGEDVTVHPHVVFGPGVHVANHVEIRSFSHIEGAKIHPKAVIGPFARLRPGANIGESAHVGNFVEIKQATLEHGAKVNHLSYIGDAHIGERANIGAGTITCNYDGFTKHRTAIGANAFIGSNSALVAPVSIGDGAIVGAGSVITEDVEPESLAVARAEQKHKLQWAKLFRNRKKN